MQEKNYDSCYKAYDIRSIVNEPLDWSFTYSLWKWVAKHLLENIWPEATFVFGADVREANNELIYRFLKWLEDGGIHSYIGVWLPVHALEGQQQLRWVCSSAMLYYIAKHSFDMWAVFTASHNPAEYVGIKMVNHEALLVPSIDLQDMVSSYESVGEIDEKDMERIWTKAMGPENALGSIVDEKLQQVSEIIAQEFGSLEKAYKVVVDFSNGSAISYEKSFLEALAESEQFEFVFLNEIADSTFSSHASDTTNPHDYEQLMKAVVDHKADFGVMFDGDADRLWFVNSHGEYVSGDLLVAIIAKNILKNQDAGSYVVYDVTSTNTIPEVVTQMWWIPIKSRVGHRYIKEKMIENNAIFGWELSWHLFFPKVWSIEFPLLALFHTLSEMEWYQTFDAMISDICKYYKPPLVNYHIQDKDTVLQKIKEKYANYEQDLTDGIRINMENGRSLVRKSNTEPKIRMYCEAKDKSSCEAIIKELETYLV